MDELRRYEIYVVFQPELDDEQLEARLDRVTGYLTGIGGEIVEVARKGKRRLAYNIDRFNQGIDVIYQANLPGPRLETIERQLNLNEDVLRYLLVRREDLEKEARKAAARPATATQPAAPVEAPVTESAATDTPAEEAPAAETPFMPVTPDLTVSAAGTVSPVGEAEATTDGAVDGELSTTETTNTAGTNEE